MKNNHELLEPKYRLSDMVRQDLTNLSKQLPYTGESHFSNLICHYEMRGWDGVNIYIDYVYGYCHEAHTVNKPLGATIYLKWTQWLSDLKQLIVGLLNGLK